MLAGYHVAAVPTADQIRSEHHVVRLILTAVQASLNAIPGRPINQRLMSTWIRLTLVDDVPNIGPIPQNVVQLTAWKSTHGIGVPNAFVDQLKLQRIECMSMVRVELEDTLDLGGIR